MDDLGRRDLMDDLEFDFDTSPKDVVPRPKRRIYQVAEITRLVRTILEDEIGTVWIEGEVSNLRRPASGHLYFTLKDASSQLSAVLFRGNQRTTEEVKDGAKLRVQGEITVYERSGNYQIIVRNVENVGTGSLQEQFEKLKQKLAAEGLFDDDRKQALPFLPRHIGIVTSETGAAVRDILHVLTRRFPHLHVLLAPVAVQGDTAATQIAQAIETLNCRKDIDVILVGRGGGSLEDLWAFNEEVVARAIAASRIPIVSAVGHEIDFTISDFVADARAPTPSVAGEIVVRELSAFVELISNPQRRMKRALQHAVQLMRQRLTTCQRSYVFKDPTKLLAEHHQRLDGFFRNIQHTIVSALQQKQQRLDESNVTLTHLVTVTIERKQQQLERLGSQLRALSPWAVLQRGYSLTRMADGTILSRAEDARPDDVLVTTLAKGVLKSSVTDIQNGDADDWRERRQDTHF